MKAKSILVLIQLSKPKKIYFVTLLRDQRPLKKILKFFLLNIINLNLFIF